MVFFIITSGHRVGSRWIHYLLADIYKKEVSPEIDVSKIVSKKRTIRNYLKNNKIPKFHGANFDNIANNIKPIDYKILGVVRDPRDRAVSYTFHNRYHKKGNFRQKKFKTDLESLNYTLYKDKTFWFEEEQQSEIMKLGLSTINFKQNTTSFLWTTYEWLHDDPYKQMKIITNFLGGDIKNGEILEYLNKHSFKNKSGREEGEEKRDDLWRRKGIIGDWKNWLDEKGIEKLKPATDTYYSKIAEEFKNGS